MARDINTSINSWDEAALVAGNYLGVSAGVYRVLVVLADTLFCSDEHLAAGQEGELRQVHGRAAGGPHGARVHGGGVRGVRGDTTEVELRSTTRREEERLRRLSLVDESRLHPRSLYRPRTSARPATTPPPPLKKNSLNCMPSVGDGEKLEAGR